MAGKQGLQNRLRQEIRRRQKEVRPQPIETGDVRRDRWHEITDRHFDVLQNIEFALVAAWRELLELDDRRIHQGLKAAMLRSRPDDPLAQEVYDRLQIAELGRSDVESDLWHDALRVVAESVRTHSSLRSSDRSYLAFVAPYVAPAIGVGEEELADYEVIEGRVTRSDVVSAEENPRISQARRGE
jgi:hypothetical protein